MVPGDNENKPDEILRHLPRLGAVDMVVPLSSISPPGAGCGAFFRGYTHLFLILLSLLGFATLTGQCFIEKRCCPGCLAAVKVFLSGGRF